MIQIPTRRGGTRRSRPTRRWTVALLLTAVLLFLSGCAIVPVSAGGGFAALVTALALAVAACGGGGGGGGGGSGGGGDDEEELAGPAFSVADTTANEGDSQIVFTVTRADDTAGETTVDYATSSGDFFTQASGTLTFGDGVEQQTVTVTLDGNTTPDFQLRFIELTLSNPSAGSLADGTALGGLIDQDNLIRAGSWDASLGSAGARLDGEAAGDDAGRAVDAGGDIDGDGTDDLIVGAPGANYDGSNLATGRVYVLTEAPGEGATALGDVGSSHAGFTVHLTESSSDQLGVSVAALGNIDGDGAGTSELGMGSAGAEVYDQPTYGGNYGSPQAVVLHGDSALEGTDRSLSHYGGEADRFVYHTDGTAMSDAKYMSYQVAPVGDFDGDGRADFLVGDRRFNSDLGAVAIVSGTSGTAVNTQEAGTDAGWYGFHLSGTPDSRQVGYSIAPAGDVDSDGYADVLLGAPGTSEGHAFLIFGGDGAFENANGVACAADGNVGYAVDGSTIPCGGTDIALPAAVRFIGEAGNDEFGRAVAAGNVNGDAYQDLIIGAPFYGGDSEGRAYVILGDGTNSLNGLVDIYQEVDFGTTTLNGTNGFTITGGTFYDNAYSTYRGDYAGSAVAAVDLNGDGADEVIIGAHRGSIAGNDLQAGKVFIIWGGSDIGSSGDIDLDSFESLADGIRIYGHDGVIMSGYNGADELGRALGSGDINGDGLTDLVIGAPGYQTTSTETDDYGAVFVLFGADIPRP